MLAAVRCHVLRAIEAQGPIRARPAHDDFRLSEPRPEEWLLAEWPGRHRQVGTR